MELSALGFGIGAAVGMFGIYLIVSKFLPTYLDSTFEKWFRVISCILVLVVCVFLGGVYKRIVDGWGCWFFALFSYLCGCKFLR